MKKTLLLSIALMALVAARAQLSLIDVNAGTPNSNAMNMAVLNGEMFIGTGINAGELWKTDGTQGGTTLLKGCIIDRYTQLLNVFTPDNYGVTLGNKMLFTAADVEGNIEPWVTDGTVNGTMQLKDINPRVTISNYPYGSLPYGYTVLNNKVYFVAIDTSYDNLNYVRHYGLWSTDGTTVGTQKIHSFRVDANASVPYILNNGLPPQKFTVYNNKLYFLASEAPDLSAPQIWVSDGTTVGTYKLMDNPANGQKDYGSFFTVLNNNLYLFNSVDTTTWGGSGTGDLWQLDVNTPSATLVKHIGISDDPYPIKDGNKLLFVAPNTNGNPSLWISDGTTAGTKLVKDINSGGGGAVAGYTFSIYHNKLFFGGYDDLGFSLWLSDYTTAGTQRVKTFAQDEYLYEPTVEYNDRLYFTSVTQPDSSPTVKYTYWQSDGTAPGTIPFATFTYTNSFFGYPANYRVMNGSLFFDAKLDTSGFEIWKLTGTVSGVTELEPALKMVVYPNPAANELNFSFTVAATHISIYNLQGERCLRISNRKTTGLM